MTIKVKDLFRVQTIGEDYVKLTPLNKDTTSKLSTAKIFNGDEVVNHSRDHSGFANALYVTTAGSLTHNTIGDCTVEFN